jgi:hypothetical protein
MKQYDFRFNTALIQSFVGKTLTKYKHAEFMYTNSVTGIVGLEINDVVYALTNEYEAIDFLSLDDEATIFRISKSKWNNIDSMINNDINEVYVNETIKKIVLVNDHIIINDRRNVAYDMHDTKGIIFCFENHELCFVKQDCWFSQEIEIYKGYNLLEKTGDGKGILEDFKTDNNKEVFVKRSIVEIQ